jgi:hypothetical protein
MNRFTTHKLSIMNTNNCKGRLFGMRENYPLGLVFSMLVLLVTLASVRVVAQPVLNKSLVSVAAPTSGTPGHFDAVFRLQVRTTIFGGAFGISTYDRLDLPSRLGSAFVSVVGAPAIVYFSPTSLPGAINPGFDGVLNNVVASGAVMPANDTVIYEIRVEVNPYAVGAPAILSNNFAVGFNNPQQFVFSNYVDIPNCWTDCQMTCNNQVQISMNTHCEAEILPSMILEGEPAACADLGFFEVSVYDGNTLLTLPITSQYLNKRLTVSVRNVVCGNRCWGYILLEDKSPPTLNCRVRDTVSCSSDVSPLFYGFPVDTKYVNLNIYPYIVTGIDSCGIVYLTYKDSLVRYDCTNPDLSATIYRKWCATDPGGYVACCYDTIDLQRGTLGDITLPPHYDGQPGHQPALNCNGNWPKLPSGMPDTTALGTGKPAGIYCGNIQYDFSDDTIQICPGTYKLIRRWLILDWCNPEFRIDFPQLIKVVDTSAPVVVCPKNYTVNTNPWNCSGSLILPVPENLTPSTIVNDYTPYVTEHCSGWTYDVKHLPAIDPKNCTPVPGLGTDHNIIRLPDGRYQVFNMPLGCNWIYYTITDGCGNSTRCQFDIEVVDRTPPVAVCHEKTVISLGSTGKATVPASVFDDHSHDNCGVVSFKVRRMDTGPCGSTTFKDNAEFCCQDVPAADGITVVLRVIDQNNNSSECMVQAIVQDKLPPIITCPDDVRVDCETDLSDLSAFGNASATDNCQVRIETRVYNNLNTCNLGEIIREFIAIDNGGLRDSCQQVITVYDADPFEWDDIVWPVDIVLDGCVDAADPAATGKPEYLNRDHCNLPVATYEDLVFNFVEGVCYKILRKWTVIDWCTYNPSNGDGIWYHTQVIKLINSEGPDFTSSCEDRNLCIESQCQVNYTFEATATDRCTPQSELRWSYSLDLYDDGSEDVKGSRNRFTYGLKEGSHRISWVVKDQCGNESRCSYLIHVRDCKRPTPYCKDGLVTVLMQNSGSVTVWASDLVIRGEDNCTDPADLKYSFSADVAHTSREFTCSDIMNGKSDTIEVTIFITDNGGNNDYCLTKIVLQDNQDACPDVPGFFSLNGYIKGYNGNPSPEVVVNLIDVQGAQRQIKTGVLGEYLFSGLDINSSYQMAASYDADPAQGITTKDIVKIQRHILGLELLDSPYKLIAADVNRSGSITARDVSELRKLILGVQSEFDNNRSWNFIDAEIPLSFDNYMNYATDVNISQPNGDQMDRDFVAVKTGDVTGEANTGFSSQTSRHRNRVTLQSQDVRLNAGEIYWMPIRTSEMTGLYGLQFSMSYDPKRVEFVAMQEGLIAVRSENYLVQPGRIRFSWNADRLLPVDADADLFYVGLKVRHNSLLSECEWDIATDGFISEVYTPDGDAGVDFRFSDEANAFGDGAYALFQNVPNPFAGESRVYFRVPNDAQVSLSLYNIAGATIRTYSVDAKAGMNSIVIKSEDIGESGILYYRLDANGFNATRKMIVIK